MKKRISPKLARDIIRTWLDQAESELRKRATALMGVNNNEFEDVNKLAHEMNYYTNNFIRNYKVYESLVEGKDYACFMYDDGHIECISRKYKERLTLDPMFV